MYRNYQVMYGYSGGSSGWTTYARSEFEAIGKWEREIKKGRTDCYVISVKAF